MSQRFKLPDPSQYPRAFGDAVQNAINNISDQSNSDPTANATKAPAQLSGFNVVESGGIHDIQFTDNSPGYRGKNFFADYSTTPDFAQYHTIDTGASQNHRANLGSGTYYWRGYHSYPTSDHSQPVYHGGIKPAPVGSGVQAGPPLQPKMGSTGYGPVFTRTSTPPVRK